MNDRYTFQLQGRNPDVLNSIANLSSDEVFTPPAFANSMLDQIQVAWAKSNNGDLIWENPDLKFLDPFTKSGVFLREIVKRLNVGLEAQIPDNQERIDHILTRQIYGAATTTLTALLTRRTVYCSKDATGKHSITSKFAKPSGNIWFKSGSHDWHGGTIKVLSADESGREVEIFTDSKCKICGVNRADFERAEGLELHAYSFIHTIDVKIWAKEAFGEEMQFDVVVGNPPYQLDDGGHGASAAPIYNKFVDQAKALNPRFLSMVIPARWYAGGKGLDQFRAKMLGDNRIRTLVDYTDSSEVFPGVKIEGGVCYFLWDRDNPGETTVKSVTSKTKSSTVIRSLQEEGSKVFIRYNEGIELLRKVMINERENDSNQISFSLPIEKSFKELVSSRKPFGFPTNFKGKSEKSADDLLIYVNGGKGFVGKKEIQRGLEYLDSWKVFIAGAYGAGNSIPRFVLGKPFVGAPYEVCSETYLTIGPFKSELEAKNARDYIATKFFRALVLLHKPAQHATQSVYTFVPMQDFAQNWTDEKLYKKYGLSSSDVEFIEEMIRPMDLENE